MGIGKAVLDFLFGKDPDIFDENGRVRHKFAESKWTQWNDRLKANPDYNWRKHGAVERQENQTTTQTQKRPQEVVLRAKMPDISLALISGVLRLNKILSSRLLWNLQLTA